VRQRHVVALGQAAAEALAGEGAASWEALAGLQKQLLAALAGDEAMGGGSTCVLDLLLDAISSARQHKVRPAPGLQRGSACGRRAARRLESGAAGQPQ
jgi:hypothetical protein